MPLRVYGDEVVLTGDRAVTVPLQAPMPLLPEPEQPPGHGLLVRGRAGSAPEPYGEGSTADLRKHATTSRVDDMAPQPPATGSDLVRQGFVVVSAVVAIVGLAFGVGRFGDNAAVEQSAGGALSDASTLVAPAGPAFSIWSVIYLGLVALAAWQLAPSRRADPRLRRTGWLIGITMLLNALWLFVVEADLLLLSAVVIVALLAALVLAYVPLFTTSPTSRVEAVLLDGTMGLYTGWVTAATIANIAAVLVAAGHTELGLGSTVWAAILIVVAAAVGIFVALVSRGRLAYGVALAWALAWISVGRAFGETRSGVIALLAGAAAVAVLAVTVFARVRAGAAPERADVPWKHDLTPSAPPAPRGH